MVFDTELNRGIRKKYLPEPNPQKVELPRDVSLATVLQKAKDLYFEDHDPELSSLSLADSAGILIPVSDQTKWTLGSFYQKNSLQPSRYKLYVVLNEVNKQIFLCSNLNVYAAYLFAISCHIGH